MTFKYSEEDISKVFRTNSYFEAKRKIKFQRKDTVGGEENPSVPVEQTEEPIEPTSPLTDIPEEQPLETEEQIPEEDTQNQEELDKSLEEPKNEIENENDFIDLGDAPPNVTNKKELKKKQEFSQYDITEFVHLIEAQINIEINNFETAVLKKVQQLTHNFPQEKRVEIFERLNDLLDDKVSYVKYSLLKMFKRMESNY